MLSDNFKKIIAIKNLEKVIRNGKRALKVGIPSSNLKIFNCFLLVLMFLIVFLTQCADNLKKRNAIEESAKSRNLIYKFEDYFFPSF
jgi:hypothetical protein